MPKVNLAKCDECPLRDKPYVPPEVVERPDIFIIGEAPGREEVRVGKPFVGRAGHILRSVLEQLRLTSVHISNTCLCQSEGPPPRDAVVCCLDRLTHEIESASPKVIVTAGAVAFHALTGDVGISEVQGLMFDWVMGEKTYKLIPSYHPAALLRRPDLFPDFVNALTKASLYTKGTGLIDCQPSDLANHLATDERTAVRYLNRLLTFQLVSCDLETTGYSPYTDTIDMVSIAVSDGSTISGYVFPWRVVCRGLPYKLLKKLLETRTVVYHNGQFDVPFLRKVGIDAKIGEDTILMHYTTDERSQQQSLKAIARKLCNAPDWKETVREYVPSVSEGTFEQVPEEVLAEYAGLDACYTLAVFSLLNDMMDPDNIRVYRNILLPVSNVFVDISLTGIKVDVEQLSKLQREYFERLHYLEEQLKQYAGDPNFNPRSVHDCRRLLYDVLGLRAYPNDTAPTGRAVLEAYQHIPAVRTLREFRETQKLLSTYLIGLSEFIIDGRIHPNLRLTGTVTGRVASNNPNMLGIPKEKGGIKSLFIADEGKLLCYMDFKQMELRVAAALSNDRNMKQSFVEGRDFHQEARERLFGKKDHYTHQEVLDAKMIVFGPMYGRGEVSLARQLGCTIEEARAYLERFIRPYPQLKAWLENNARTAVEEGELRSYFGRCRRWGLITPDNVVDIEHEARNFPVQSTASDLTLLTMLKIYNTFDHDDVMPLLPIHDAILLSIDKRRCEELLDELRRIATTLPQELLNTDVPFDVDFSVSERWM